MAVTRTTSPGFNDPRYRLLIDQLKERRLSLGVSQEALGKRLGLHKQFVSRFELGERRLDVVEFADVARALELNPSDLVGSIADA